MQHLLLKILTGPNAGAEAVLAGRTVVGSSGAADITIADPELVAEHFALQAEGQNLSITVGDAPVTVGKELRRNGTFRVAPFELIKFGTTCCAVGPEGAAWPAFNPADLLPPAPPQPEPAPAEAPPPAEQAAPPPAAEAAKAAPRRSRWVVPVATLVLLLVLLGGGYVLYDRFVVDEVVMVKRATAQEIVAAQQATGVTVRPDGRHGLVAEGFVASSEQQRRLRQALLDADIAIKYRVVSLEQQVSAVRTIVAAAGAPLAVEPDPKAGRIVLEGFLPDRAHVDTLERVLRRDIADLRPLEIKIATPDTVRSEVSAQLAAAGLEGHAGVEVAGNTVRITGALADDGRAAVRRIADQLSSRWKPLAKVEDATTARAAAAPAPAAPAPVPAVTVPPSPSAGTVTVKSSPPPAKIVIIVGGKDGFVRDEEGRRYEVGDKLANGEVIEEIRVEEIVTSRDGVKYRYTFGGGR